MTEQDHTPQAQPASDEKRRAALDAAIHNELTAGAKLVDRTKYQASVRYGGSGWNLLLVLFTSGLWLLAYSGWRERRYVLAVNEAAQVWRREQNTEQWEPVDG